MRESEVTTGALEEALSRYWGYDGFRPLQREAMESVLAGRDSLVVLPTGGGKSLCYQAPAVAMDGMAVVISPLIALMKDQVDGLTECGVPAACIHSMLTDAERRETAAAIRGGGVKLLYVAPERAVQERFVAWLKEGCVISFVAVDEAHCVSMWGHDFRPEYRALASLKAAFPGAAMHAYTATATPHVREDIVRELGLDGPEVLIGNFDRPNLTYSVLRRSQALEQVCEVVERNRGASGIVYCISRKGVEQTCADLCGRGYRALPYHAGMEDDDRKRNQDAFIRDEADIIVATVAFGMGIDKPDVRYVVHTGMPKSIEHYQQESGRAGRDGLASECVLLYSGGDFGLWKGILEKQEAESESDPEQAEETRRVAMRKLGDMYGYCTGMACRHRALVAYFGQERQAPTCEACDVCLETVAAIENAGEIARTLVAAVREIDGCFGAAYLTRILRGVADERTRANGHDRLEGWGKLADQADRTVRDWVEQLTGQAFLERVGEYGVLRVTAEGRELLSGQAERNPLLARPAATTTTRRKLSAAAARSMEGADAQLFEALRSLRQEVTRAKNVPAYIVFNDATLMDMARVRPSNATALLAVRGVGERKAKRYGEQFLPVIREHCEARSLEMDVGLPPELAGTPMAREAREAEVGDQPQKRPLEEEAARLFSEGASLEEAVGALRRSAKFVGRLLENWLRDNEVTDPEPWVDGPTFDRILEATRAEASTTAMKALRKRLGPELEESVIRVACICIDNQARRRPDATAAPAPLAAPRPMEGADLRHDAAWETADRLYDEGKPVAEVAEATGRDEGWAWAALAAHVRERRLGAVFKWLPHDAYLAVAMAANRADSLDFRRVVSRLDGNLPEGQVRVALACLQNRGQNA